MRYHTKILIWENARRLDKLIEFRELAIEYFNNSRPAGLGNSSRIEEDPAREARFKINLVIDEVHSIILHSGTIPILTVNPPPAVGGYQANVDLIANIFNLNGLQIEPNHVVDCIDRVIGKYESNHKSAFFRIFNPFFSLGWFLDVVSDLPFIAFGKFGFDQQKMKTSIIGRFVKGIMFLAPFLAILHYLDFLDPVKQFVHKLLGFNETN